MTDLEVLEKWLAAVLGAYNICTNQEELDVTADEQHVRSGQSRLCR